jgi:hypothetical protein
MKPATNAASATSTQIIVFPMPAAKRHGLANVTEKHHL